MVGPYGGTCRNIVSFSSSSTPPSTPEDPNSSSSPKLSKRNNYMKTAGIIGLGFYLGLCLFKDGSKVKKEVNYNIFK